jgi:hypothetical protein
MTPASSITIAAIFTAGFAASVAAAPREPRPTTPASAVSSSSLPSCSADGKRNRGFIGGKGFRGGASGMYGQVFFASGGGSRATFSESNSRGGRFSGPGNGNGAGNGNGNANGPQDPGANGPGRGPNASDELDQGRGNGPVRDAGVGAVVNPEPGTLILIGAGLGAMAFRRRRQARKNQGL